LFLLFDFFFFFIFFFFIIFFLALKLLDTLTNSAYLKIYIELQLEASMIRGSSENH